MCLGVSWMMAGEAEFKKSGRDEAPISDTLFELHLCSQRPYTIKDQYSLFL